MSPNHDLPPGHLVRVPFGGVSHDALDRREIESPRSRSIPQIVGPDDHLLVLADRTVDLPVEKRTTRTGALRLSSPELTVVDLVANPHLAGGLHNIVSVLLDLDLDPARLAAVARHYPRVVARRLGWLLQRAERGLDLERLRDVAAPAEGEALPLDPHGERSGLHDRSWGLIVNDDVIARGGEPIARLVPVVAKGRRTLGQDRGLFEVPEDFDAPLPPEIIEAFES